MKSLACLPLFAQIAEQIGCCSLRPTSPINCAALREQGRTIYYL